ncbi:MAG: SPOR domain-containing protein [Robiginitomaculum sp.]|nr:SPOR domain-containing protein [Robiginitomaculum sp.]
MENEPQDTYLPEGDSEALQPFDVREQSTKRGMMWLVGGVVFLLILAFVVLKLFSSGVRDRDQTPRILAENSPYKEVPKDKGGVQTPNQGMEVYDKMNGVVKQETITVLPPTEQPLPKPQSVTKPAANIVIKEPGGQQVVVSQKPKITASNYVVQVASLRSRDEATMMWGKLSGKMQAFINDQHYADIKRVDLTDKGIYYRLRIAGLANKSAATSLCAQLKSGGQDCIVTKK